MLRNLFAAFVLTLFATAGGIAQDWATKMFEVTSHDFGTVARGSKAQFRFQFKNIYEEDLHILGIRSSCTCTVPQLTRSDLKTFETAEVIADFNTRDHLGQKSATVIVKCQIPSRSDIPMTEVQLHVKGIIRSDVVVQPGAIDLGTVDVGKAVEKKLLVSYAGRENWKILDVKTADPHFEVEVTELMRVPGKVSYELLIRLTNDAPVGYIKDQLILVTSDPRAREFPVDVQGRVMSDITISPSELFLGVVHPGRTVKKTLVVRGKKPFKIVDIKCADKSFEIDPPKDAKLVHVIPVIFTAGDDPGRVAQKISIETDQGGVVQAFTAFVEIVKAKDGDSAAGKTAEKTDKDDGDDQ